MKKLTKKTINAAAQYILNIDWQTSYRNDIAHIALNSTDLMAAMAEAETYFDEEKVYMMTVASKTAETLNSCCIVYREQMASRTAGTWRIMDGRHENAADEIAYSPELNEGYYL